MRANQIVDYLALMGDTDHNIPGVPKCGPKTAAKWLVEYDSLDGVIANAGKISGKIGESLREALPRLPLNRELTTIKTDVVLDQAITDLQLRERHVDLALIATRPDCRDILLLSGLYCRVDLEDFHGSFGAFLLLEPV